jgi:hypothetical protein
MAFHKRRRDPSAMDPRLSPQDDSGPIFSLFVIFTIAAAVFAGFYYFSSSGPTKVAETTVGPAVTRPLDPTAPPAPKSTQEETRPTQAPIP